MKSYTLRLQDATHAEEFDDVVSFVGEDSSGSFGILADHGRMLTTLVFGLARFRRRKMAWEYLALPGGVLYFENGVLTVSCRRYLRDTDFERIVDLLDAQLLREEETLHDMKESLHRMEEEVLKRMWRLGQGGALGR